MRSARVLEGELEHDDAVLGKDLGQGGMHGGGVERILGGDFARPRVRLGHRARGLGHRLQQRLQGQLHVGDDRVPHRRPGSLVGVAGDRDQLRSLGKQRAGDVGVIGEDGAASDKDQVVPLQGLADRPDRRRQHTAEVGVALGEAEFAATRRGGCPDRQALAFGQRNRRVPATAGIDVRAGDEDRVGGRIELLGKRLHHLGAGDGAAGNGAPDRLARVGLLDLGVPVVHRQRDEDGALRRQRGEVGAVGECERHVLRPRRLVSPLDQRVGHADRVAVGQVRLQGHLRPRLLAGGDQERRVVRLRVEDRPHRVADAGRGVQVGERGAAGGLGVAVGHPDHDRLVQAEHEAEIAGEVGEHRQLGRSRVAEDGRHSLGTEEVEAGVAHGQHAWDPTFAALKSGPSDGR